jgi:hypothetical protein
MRHSSEVGTRAVIASEIETKANRYRALPSMPAQNGTSRGIRGPGPSWAAYQHQGDWARASRWTNAVTSRSTPSLRQCALCRGDR